MEYKNLLEGLENFCTVLWRARVRTLNFRYPSLIYWISQKENNVVLSSACDDCIAFVSLSSHFARSS